MSKKLSHYRTQKTAVCLMSAMHDRSYSINSNSIMFIYKTKFHNLKINILMI